VERRNIIGERVTEARKNAKPRVTQKDLAARLELQGLRIYQSTISQIERGLRPVPDFEVVALAKALKVEVGWLLSGE
jgi:transcriptional regulator with XRE-family HTH domain